MLSSKLPPCCHISLPYIMGFGIEIIQTMHSHASIVIIVIIAMLTLCYSIMSHVTLIFLLSCIHVDTVYLLNITCTLVATCVIFGRLECIVMGGGNLDAIHVGY